MANYNPNNNFQNNNFQNNMYSNMYQAPQQSQPLKQYTFVNGIEGAKAYPLMPNQMMLLMDSDNPVLYKKTSDQMGKSSLEYFVINAVSENEVRDMLTPKQPDYAFKSDIENITNNLNSLNTKLDEFIKRFEKPSKNNKE